MTTEGGGGEAGGAAGAAAASPPARQVTIVNAKGLHARAAARFVRTAEPFDARVEVARDDDLSAGGTSILGLMLLAASTGTVLTLTATGPDARAALDALVALVEDGFGERS